MQRRYSGGQEDLLFDADPDALEKMASNYLINAVKHTPGGGQIHLEVRQRGNGLLRLSVTDTGEGIQEMSVTDSLTPSQRSLLVAEPAIRVPV